MSFPRTLPTIEKILYIMDNQGAEYYKLNAGTTASLQQYYYVGDYMAERQGQGHCSAGLRDSADSHLRQAALTCSPMDQVERQRSSAC